MTTSVAEVSGNRFPVEGLTRRRAHVFFIGRFVRGLGRAGCNHGKTAISGAGRRVSVAIAARDPEAARRATADHIEASGRRVFRGSRE